MSSSKSLNKKQSIFLLVGIVIIAFNLRPALASLGPLVESIRIDTGLSNLLLGLLTTLPLIAFGTISIFAPLFTKRFGIGKVLFSSLLLLTIGIVIRSIDWVPALYIGTLLLGIAIAFGNVLLPGLTKRNFSSNSGIVTSLYSSSMAIGAAVAAGVSVPLATRFNLGWQGSLSVWALFSALAVIVWLPQLWWLKKAPSKRAFISEMQKMLRKPLAWYVSLYMGLQSFGFYVMLAWLPVILIDRGYDAETAGWLLSLSQGAGILGSVLVPYFAGLKKEQRWIVIILSIIEILSIFGLMFPSFGTEWIWVSLIGFVLGGTFGLSLLFLVLRTNSTDEATELSGMSQSIGYFIAALGPVLMGMLFDFTGNWVYPLALLAFLTIIKLFMGLGAAKEETV